MKIKRVCLHSLFLTVVNIVSIIVGFGVYYLLEPGNQIAIQAPIAGILSIITFVIWSVFIKNLFSRIWSLQDLADSNIRAIWQFQLPVNLIAIFAVLLITKVITRKFV